MKPQQIYLTIDDSPSQNTTKMVTYLRENSIPAIFFCRGEFIQNRMDEVQFIIKNGYLVGNHSYTHPYFSTISLEQCFDEIVKTDLLIEQCYQHVNVKRPVKIIRLPFADRGAGKWAQSPSTEQEKEKVNTIQKFLRDNNFESLFDSEGAIDAFWDWDTQDYKSRFISSPTEYLLNLEKQWSGIDSDCPVMLIHDFDNNYPLFQATMRFLKQNHMVIREIL